MDIQSHKRVNDILLAPLEKPLLQWLAARMPSWIVPDALTAVGVVGAVIIFGAYCSTNLNDNFLWLASFGFILNWFGDALDGTLARYRKIERPKYGFFSRPYRRCLLPAFDCYGFGALTVLHLRDRLSGINRLFYDFDSGLCANLRRRRLPDFLR